MAPGAAHPGLRSQPRYPVIPQGSAPAPSHQTAGVRRVEAGPRARGGGPAPCPAPPAPCPACPATRGRGSSGRLRALTARPGPPRRRPAPQPARCRPRAAGAGSREPGSVRAGAAPGNRGHGAGGSGAGSPQPAPPTPNPAGCCGLGHGGAPGWALVAPGKGIGEKRGQLLAAAPGTGGWGLGEGAVVAPKCSRVPGRSYKASSWCAQRGGEGLGQKGRRVAACCEGRNLIAGKARSCAGGEPCGCKASALPEVMPAPGAVSCQQLRGGR